MAVDVLSFIEELKAQKIAELRDVLQLHRQALASIVNDAAARVQELLPAAAADPGPKRRRTRGAKVRAMLGLVDSCLWGNSTASQLGRASCSQAAASGDGQGSVDGGADAGVHGGGGLHCGCLTPDTLLTRPALLLYAPPCSSRFGAGAGAGRRQEAPPGWRGGCAC